MVGRCAHQVKRIDTSAGGVLPSTAKATHDRELASTFQANLAAEFAGPEGGRTPKFIRANFNAFPITITSDKPIAAAHKTGLMKPIAASGIAATL